MTEELEVGVLRGLVCLDNPMDFLGLPVDNTRYREIQKKKPRPSARFYTFRARSSLACISERMCTLPFIVDIINSCLYL